MTFEEFVATVKARGCTALLKEVNTYGTNWELPCLYATVNQKLIGVFGPAGAYIYPKSSVHWSTKGRKFNETKI